MPTTEFEKVEHSTTFDGSEPETPTLHHTPNGIFLRMDEHALQALAIMAQVFLSTSTDQRRLITAYGACECAVDEMAEQISDAT